MASLKEFTANFVKLDRFDGANFRRWQKKLHFLLSSLKVVYVLTTPKPVETEDDTLAAQRERLKWEQDDYVCNGHICNSMSDALFDIYHEMATAKEIWDALEGKYISHDATSKKFLVQKFFNYKMTDDRSIVEQFHEIMHIHNQFNQFKMHMDDSIIVSAIMDKLPPSWKECKKSLKHKKEDMSIEQLGTHLRIEEECRFREKTDDSDFSSKVHMVD